MLIMNDVSSWFYTVTGKNTGFTRSKSQSWYNKCKNVRQIHVRTYMHVLILDIYMSLYAGKLYVYVFMYYVYIYIWFRFLTRLKHQFATHALKKIDIISAEVKSLATALLSHGCKVWRRADDFHDVSWFVRTKPGATVWFLIFYDSMTRLTKQSWYEKCRI